MSSLADYSIWKFSRTAAVEPSFCTQLLSNYTLFRGKYKAESSRQHSIRALSSPVGCITHRMQGQSTCLQMFRQFVSVFFGKNEEVKKRGFSVRDRVKHAAIYLTFAAVKWHCSVIRCPLLWLLLSINLCCASYEQTLSLVV